MHNEVFVFLTKPFSQTHAPFEKQILGQTTILGRVHVGSHVAPQPLNTSFFEHSAGKKIILSFIFGLYQFIVFLRVLGSPGLTF